MKSKQTTQKEFIENILLTAAKNKISKLDVIGSLEMAKLILYNNDNTKAIRDIGLSAIIGDAVPVQVDFINNVLIGLTKINISKLDAIGLLEMTKLLIYKTDFRA